MYLLISLLVLDFFTYRLFRTCITMNNYIWFYHHERFQKKLNHCAPVEYRNTMVA
ncbi:IS3 family transposase [Saccharococcus caldoxylosilyticus]|uniref:IS3 family transposase n=1 Tax=Saccharococcus caldoxylosilyticus TaxID=81408 RepID=UPI0039647BE7